MSWIVAFDRAAAEINVDLVVDGATAVAIVAVAVSVAALSYSIVSARAQLRLTRDTNSLPTLIELFAEHRGDRLAQARDFVHHRLSDAKLKTGYHNLPKQAQRHVRDLMWFYDNLGVLVVHGIVPIEPVSGYLGGSAQGTWYRLKPMVYAERERRNLHLTDQEPDRWQHYFELLVERIEAYPPALARTTDQSPVRQPRRRRFGGVK